MARYTGNTCPICEKKFTDHDDIVVCPDCGTPYHRACWQKTGVCLHEAEHAAGYAWQSDLADGEEAHDAICANCGTHNLPGAERCSHCGVPLAAQTAEPNSQNTATPIYTREKPQQTSGAPRLETYTAGPDGGVYRREIGPEDAIDGIKARDWASYLGRSSIYYLMQFFRMSESKRTITACFSALIFGPAYLFYRKMWKEGVLTGILFLLLQIPSMLGLIAAYNPTLLGGMPTGWLPYATTICNVGTWVLQVIIMLYAVSWYKQSCTKRIHSIYERIPEGEQRTNALSITGGTSLATALLCVVLYYLFVVICINLAGPELMRSLLAMYGL